MLHSALVSLLLSLFLLPSSWSTLHPRRPSPRTYDTHSYYTLELSATTLPEHLTAVANHLGVEIVEPLGELAGHWLVRTEGKTHDHHVYARSMVSTQDPVLRRWKDLQSSPTKRSFGTSTQLRSLTPLTLRQRSKRSSNHLTPAPRIHPKSLGSPSMPFPRDDEELLYAQNELHLADPMLGQQWHLINQDMKEVELNVTGLWGQGITGKGVKVVIVDDGLDMESDDLKENFYPEGSYDFNDHTELPVPRLSDDQHGTRCAGEIAAVPNDVCGVGVSYNAKIAGVRILSAPISDADEAAALNYAYQLNDIYSCSWGPPDDGKSMEAPEGLILKAMVNGVQNGRGGKGSLFVFAAGNGGGVDDQCNFDGYTNSIFSITVGAVDRKGLHPYYSELCSAMMMVAPSSGSGDHIHTTDTGKDRCSHTHGGTSAAAPLAVGVFALALSVRPELTWRDFQHISVLTGVHFNPDDPDWSTTSAGRKYSYKYGYGRIDAGAFVDLARTWDLVKPQAWFDSPAVYLPDTPAQDLETGGLGNINDRRDDQDDQDDPDEPIKSPEAPENPQPEVAPSGSFITADGVTSTYEVTQDMLDDSNFERLEHVTVRVWIEHQRRGDVEVQITSPNGIVSVLARQRRFDEADTGLPGWKFMSLKHWDENPVGTWSILVRDAVNSQKTGRFIAWSLQLWGECVDPALAKDWAPAEEGMPDEEEIGSDPTATVTQKPKPTEGLPDDHAAATGEADQPGLERPTATPGNEDIAEPTTTPSAGDSETDETGIDQGLFDGVKGLASNSTWLASAGGIIVLFGAGIGAFFFFRARNRRRNLFGLSNDGEGARGAYAPVSEDVPMGLLARGRRKLGGRGSAGGGSNAAGTKELYDAFGDGPSDESDSDDGDKGETAGLRYHDDFLEDEGEEREGGYKDDEPEKPRSHSPREGQGSGSASSESWQDAGEDLRK